MRKQLILLALVSLPTTALAQSPELETTCETVAKNFLLTDKLAVGVVQSFPDLQPPGVRFTYSTRQGTAPADMSDTFACDFGNTTKPYQLSRFCVSSTCYSSTEDDADRKRRFAEERILLERSQK